MATNNPVYGRVASGQLPSDVTLKQQGFKVNDQKFISDDGQEYEILKAGDAAPAGFHSAGVIL